MEQCQDSGSTCYNRHPDIFGQAKGILPRNQHIRVLSFGCSSGEEVRTLRDLGGSFWHVDGAEVQPALLAKARSADPKGTYVADARVLPVEHYDAIFCMSVLCRFCSPPSAFPFEAFERALSVVVDLLRPGGLLVVYNAQYDVRETNLPLEPLPGEVFGGSGFVPKFTKSMDSEIPADIAKAIPYLYRKSS